MSTPRNSASRDALVQSVMDFSCAASINLPGVPCHNKPEMTVFVSSTRRTANLGAVGVNFSLNFFRRHGRQGVGHQGFAY